LVDLAGDDQVLVRAESVLAGAGADVLRALADLAAIGRALRLRYPHVEVCFDLCELRGYRYHSGCVFAAYVAGRSQDVAKGGRYDGIGDVFGRPRPATGFSVDVKTLADIAVTDVTGAVRGILAPAGDDEDLRARVAGLRAAGERVVCALPDVVNDLDELQCDRVLQRGAQGWQVVPR